MTPWYRSMELKPALAKRLALTFSIICQSCLCLGDTPRAERPNVILVMIDDMGYGDLTCHGSPHIATPNLDRLYETAARLTDFHVAPMCSPTRGQLLTGIDAMRNGSTVVASSRMMVRAEIPMLPAHLAAAGYATAVFGKWHLGENYPHRPQDRGFQEALWFPLQEIGSLSDHWQNDYFDPVLRRHDGQTARYSGYCTDIFFSQAIDWMRREHTAGRPFFCYIALNVVHGPQWAPPELRHSIAKQFPNLSSGQVGYLAMLANADANFGRLEQFLQTQQLRDDTLVIFLSDNGGYALIGEYNAGMRDGKSRLAEGGHRVPCFIRWPRAGLGGEAAGRDVAGLTQVQDLYPTVLELCNAQPSARIEIDGISLASALLGKGDVPDRTLIVQYGEPQPFHMACVMHGSWRLLTDRKGAASGAPELYNLADDPLQKNNLIETHSEHAVSLRAAYDRWWARVEPATRERTYVVIGDSSHNPLTLNSAEWRTNAMPNLLLLRTGVKRRGLWDVEIARTADYEISLRRWPEESGLSLRATAPAWTPRDTETPDHAHYPAGTGLPVASARLRVGQEIRVQRIAEQDLAAVFRVHLDPVRTELEATLHDEEGNLICGAYFVTVRALD